MVKEKFGFSEVHLGGKLCVNFHSVGLLAKFEFQAVSLDKTRLNHYDLKLSKESGPQVS